MRKIFNERIQNTMVLSTQTKALSLGLLGVFIFSFTSPLTRLATGSENSPQMSGGFITFGRGLLAGLLSVAYLFFKKEKLPAKNHWPLLALTSLGVCLGFPFFISVALRYLESVHVSAVLSGLPLLTAILGSLCNRQKPPLLFWSLAVSGCLMIFIYIVYSNREADFTFKAADLLIILGMLSAASGYVFGAKLSDKLPAQSVISWALVLMLPINLIGVSQTYPAVQISFQSWMALIYLGVFSMWLGFFAWYSALRIGGTVKVSQVQQLQPFFSILLAIPILGEQPDISVFLLGFGVLVIVFFIKKIKI